MEISRIEKTDKSTSDAVFAALTLARDDPNPLHVQLANEFKRLILSRILMPGSKIPASRPLAEELGVSRVTVVSAVNELVAEGYADGRRGSGVYVAADLPDHTLKANATACPSIARLAPSAIPSSPVLPLRPAAPEVRQFPHEIWARLMLKTWRAPGDALLAPPDPSGWLALRHAVAEHLAVFRGLPADPSQVVITSGTSEALEIIARTVLSPDDCFLVEEPGYPSMWQTLHELGLEPVHLPVDDEGFDIALAPDAARAVFVTPSRHYPTGVTMPLSRRLALLEWARERQGWIIEDDYDSEYRYRGRPLPPLASLDDSRRVLYVGSFSKTMLPGLRLGYLVVPPALAWRFAETIAGRGSRAALMMQPVLARFMTEGHYGAHIRRMRRLYAKRQAVLLAAIDRHAGAILAAEPEPAGMHLVARLANGLDDREAERRALKSGVAASALSRYFAGAPTRQGLLLGYAGFDENTIDDAVRRLAEVLA